MLSVSLQCYYSTEKDARKSASKAYVESLKTRIQSLESTLANMGVSVKEDDQLNNMSDRMDVPSSPVSPHSPSDEAVDRDDDGPIRGPLMVIHFFLLRSCEPRPNTFLV